jgi:hypothetical protein
MVTTMWTLAQLTLFSWNNKLTPTPNPKIVKRNVQVARLHEVKEVASCDFLRPQSVKTDGTKWAI